MFSMLRSTYLICFARSPGLAVSPAGPIAPAAPWTPFSPRAPPAPVEPVSPRNPRPPSDPLEPVSPRSPLLPPTPCEPVSPFSPVGPAGPGGPGIPRCPRETFFFRFFATVTVSLPWFIADICFTQRYLNVNLRALHDNGALLIRVHHYPQYFFNLTLCRCP